MKDIRSKIVAVLAVTVMCCATWHVTYSVLMQNVIGACSQATNNATTSQELRAVRGVLDNVIGTK